MDSTCYRWLTPTRRIFDGPDIAKKLAAEAATREAGLASQSDNNSEKNEKVRASNEVIEEVRA